MAVAFYIPSVDEDELVKPNQAYHHHQQQQQQQEQQQQQQQQSAASQNVSQQVCAVVDEYQRQHLMLLFHEILVAYAREAIFAQQSKATPEPCLLCKKLYYLFRQIY